MRMRNMDSERDAEAIARPQRLPRPSIRVREPVSASRRSSKPNAETTRGRRRLAEGLPGEGFLRSASGPNALNARAPLRRGA